jgi:hypothetical protein
MPQLNVYVDEDLLKKIEKAARLEHSSISGWVRKRLAGTMENAWPEGYFDLLGSLADTDLHRPAQGRLADDARKAKL